MRAFPVLLALALLAGCADSEMQEKPGTTLLYPAKDMGAVTKAANDQCSAYHKTAKLQKVEDHPTGPIAVFACE